MQNPTTNRSGRARRSRLRRRDDRGEGVISLAIGVLIMAFLGAGMWVAFHATMTNAQDRVNDQVDQIGAGG